jgi:hypothetical protein
MDNLGHDEASAMAVINTNPPATRRRQMGPVGTTARIIVGTLLVGSVAQGHLARGFHPSAWALGLVGFPAVLVGLQWLRARRTPTRRRPPGRSATPSTWPCSSPCTYCLYLLEATSDAARG